MLFFLIVILRVISVVHWSDFKFPDEFWYTEIAQNLVDGHGYVMAGDGHNRFAVCKAPALPYTLAAVGKVVRLSPMTVKLVNQLMSVGAILFFAGAVGMATQSRFAVLLMLLFGGFHPPSIYAGATNYPQNGQALLLGALFFSMVFRMYRRRDAFLQKRWMMLDGFLVGLGGLFVPTHIYILPGVYLFWLLMVKDGSSFVWFRSSLRYALWGLVGVLLAIGPWTVRNALAEHAFIPFTATAGQQFYTGFNARATMNSGTQVGMDEGMDEDFRSVQTAKEFDAVHWKYALNWVGDNRGAATRLAVLKALNYFRWDNGGLNAASDVKDGLVWVQRLTSLFVFALFAGGVLTSAPRERVVGLVVVLMVFVTALGHALFITRYRYRIPFEPLMMAVGWMGLVPKFWPVEKGKDQLCR